MVETPKKKPIELKPLEGFDFQDADGFVCDVETGICGPVKKEKETKE